MHLSQTLFYRDTEITLIDHNGQPWLNATDLAHALGYKDASAVTRIYSRHRDEFPSSMTTTIIVPGPKDSPILGKTLRIFSPRGCHLVAMFSKTHRAKDFRRWALDVLEKVEPPAKRADPLPAPAAACIPHSRPETAEDLPFVTRAGDGSLTWWDITGQTGPAIPYFNENFRHGERLFEHVKALAQFDPETAIRATAYALGGWGVLYPNTGSGAELGFSTALARAAILNP